MRGAREDARQDFSSTVSVVFGLFYTPNRFKPTPGNSPSLKLKNWTPVGGNILSII